MRAVVQRVSYASVSVDGECISKIDKGLVAFIGVSVDDKIEDVDYIADKIVNLRIFEDEDCKMNRSIQDIDASLLIISQFTLLGDVRKGRRPSFIKAAPPEKAQKLYEALVDSCKKKVKTVEKGQFQAHMIINVLNDGPVTVLLDSDKLF